MSPLEALCINQLSVLTAEDEGELTAAFQVVHAHPHLVKEVAAALPVPDVCRDGGSSAGPFMRYEGEAYANLASAFGVRSPFA